MTDKRTDLIYLTGFMGSGKSTIAPILANSLGYTALDLDHEIEAASGKTISEIFRVEGETAFRTLERTVLHTLSQQSGCVISLGGGTVVGEENLHLVRSSGILIYLKMRPETLFQRLKRHTNRPMLHDEQGSPLSGEDAFQRITALLAAREPFYTQADITILNDEQRVGRTVDEIMRRLREYLK